MGGPGQAPGNISEATPFLNRSQLLRQALQSRGPARMCGCGSHHVGEKECPVLRRRMLKCAHGPQFPLGVLMAPTNAADSWPSNKWIHKMKVEYNVISQFDGSKEASV